MLKEIVVRRKLLLNPKFQLHFLAVMVGLSLLVNAVFYGAIMRFFSQFRAKGLGFGLNPDHPFFRFLNDQQHTMLIIFFASSAVAIVILAIGGLYLSHRVAGPLHRLKSQIDQHSSNPQHIDVSKIAFRKNDYFHELVESYSQLLAKLNGTEKK